MIINFTKMHGIGNDYIYIDCFKEKFTADDAKKYAPIFSHRHYSVGADGIILIMPSDIADVKMRMFNYDGSESEMCGNGVRCVAKYAYDKGISKNNPMKIETLRGILEAKLFIKDSEVDSVEINMDSPIFDGLKIPTTIDKNPIIDEPINVDGKIYNFTAVSMGNPHAVIFLDDIDNIDINYIGSYIENTSPNAAESYRDSVSGGNIFFRPISLYPFISAISTLAIRLGNSCQETLSARRIWF